MKLKYIMHVILISSSTYVYVKLYRTDRNMSDYDAVAFKTTIDKTSYNETRNI